MKGSGIVRRFNKALARLWPPVLAVCLLIAGWHISIGLFGLNPFIIPAPLDVVQAIVDNGELILDNTKTTLAEAGLGMFVGTLLAILASVAFLYSKRLEEVSYPILLGVQAVPLIAIAPILTLWLGFGIAPKVVLAAFLTYPLTLVSLMEGFDSCPRNVLELLYTLKATKRQEIFAALVPSAIPMFMTSLKLGAAVAIVGAIATEYVGSLSGLGFLLQHTQAQLQVPLMWGVCLIAVVIGSTLYAIFAALERLIPAETTTHAVSSTAAA
ncbi:hypothetical protein A5784_17915 [Mycobacterium sp. 852013-50091_SCH5140682]|nr:hypothetical protein A5784_17915 [Mycobacterium sp. 852013-50091_SCH5140682]